MNNFKLKTLFWECTLRCNAYCKFCGSRCGDVKSDELTGEEILACFREVAEGYDPSEIMINVTGGEPLLRADLFEVMKNARELGFHWGMVTNGVLITDEVIEKMKSAGMSTISVSIDGVGELHDSLRGIPGAFDKIISGVRSLAEADFLDCIQVTTVVNSENVDSLDELYSVLSTLGIDSWRVAIVDPIGRARDNDRLLLDAEGLRKYFEFLERSRSFDGMDVTTSCSHYLGELDGKYRNHRFSCNTGKSVASILANGDVFVCPNVERRPELIQGNVKTDSFVDLWERGFSFFRSEERCLSEKCRGCSSWDKCKGDSLHTWNFDDCTPNFCIVDIGVDAVRGEYDAVIDKYKKALGPFSGIELSFSGNLTKKLVFSPIASDKLYEYFDFGKVTPVNTCEQMCGLYGHYVGNTFLVEHVIPLYLKFRSTTEAAFDSVTLESAMEELRVLNEYYRTCDEVYNVTGTPFILGGFIHSHPLGLDAVLSEPDAELHRIMRDRLDSYTTSVIVNPQKREIYAYYGKSLDVIDVELLTRSPDKWEL